MAKYRSCFAVEYTILNETRVIAYQIIVDTQNDGAAASAAGDAQFAAEVQDADLVPHEVIADAKQRAQLDRNKTWWRNRCAYSHDVLVT